MLFRSSMLCVQQQIERRDQDTCPQQHAQHGRVDGMAYQPIRARFGVDQMQRSFKPMVESVELWRSSQISDVAAKLIIYEAFIEGGLEIPRHLAPRTHELYFNPEYEEFAPKTMWSLSNAFTSGLKYSSWVRKALQRVWRPFR